jgi:hypothetical protein
MKSIWQRLFPTVLAFTLLIPAPVYAAGHKELSPQTKDKLNQLVKLRMKLDQLGAKPRFPPRTRPAVGGAPGDDSRDGVRTQRLGRHHLHPAFRLYSHLRRAGLSADVRRLSTHERGANTAITNVIIPIAITVPLLDANQNFTGTEVTFYGSTKVANTVRSPIYRSANFAVDPKAGKTQWGDAMQRVTFFNSLKPDTNDWHVLLATPIIAPTVNTSDFFDGFAIDFGDGTPLFAFISGEYIDGIIASYLATHPLPPDVLPVFVTYNSLLFYGGDPFGGCCVLGYHDALVTGTHGNNLVVQTFLFADWNDADIFVVPIQDIHALSHEVAEWLNDPFINNVVPPYTNGEGTGCDTIMETGDQLVGNTVPVTINGFTYHPQTQDVLQWFTRETPSSALGGLYRFPDDPSVPNTPAPPCP